LAFSLTIVSAYIEEISQIYYSHLRPLIIREQKAEILGSLCTQLNTASASHAAFNDVRMLALQDAQARLVFIVLEYVRTDIENYVPTSPDLNYPERLKGMLDR